MKLIFISLGISLCYGFVLFIAMDYLYNTDVWGEQGWSKIIYVFSIICGFPGSWIAQFQSFVRPPLLSAVINSLIMFCGILVLLKVTALQKKKQA